MRLLIYTIFISFIFIGSVIAGPKFVSINGENINTGNHMRGKEVTYELKFTNEGDEDLQISAVNTTCGCSSALLSGSTLKPGESGTIKFTFNGIAMGKVQKAILVHTNDEIGIHTINFEMNMVDPVTLNPTSIIATGKKGDEIKQTATIMNSFGKDVTISEITSNTPAIKTSIDKKVLANNESANIDILIKVYEDSPVNGAVFIKTTEGEFQIPVFVDVQ